MKLNGLVSFVRFAANGSTPTTPHIKTSRPTYRLSFSTNVRTCTFAGLNTADRSTKSFHATEMLLIPHTSNPAVFLTLQTRAVTECDLLITIAAITFTETGNLRKKSRFKIASCKTSVCDQCMCIVLIL